MFLGHLALGLVPFVLFGFMHWRNTTPTAVQHETLGGPLFTSVAILLSGVLVRLEGLEFLEVRSRS